jgi:hypothetical protein
VKAFRDGKHRNINSKMLESNAHFLEHIYVYIIFGGDVKLILAKEVPSKLRTGFAGSQKRIPP